MVGSGRWEMVNGNKRTKFEGGGRICDVFNDSLPFSKYSCTSLQQRTKVARKTIFFL